ncbi:WD40-repeat-containing domain protein [Pilobolus umbonatus]|nr:WD40-repeat-containing domain protein [Pilobolus umbonatus]
MVYLRSGDIIKKFREAEPNKHMPILYHLNRSLGWRIIAEKHESHVKGVRSDVYDVEDDGYSEDYLTSLALADHLGFLFLGSGSKEGNLYCIKDGSAEKDMTSGQRFKCIHKESLNRPIHSMDYSSNHLLVGSNLGKVGLYRAQCNQDSSLQEVKLLLDYVNPIPQRSVEAASYALNTHVKNVEFSPLNNSETRMSDQFLSTTMNQLNVWNTSNNVTPVLQTQPSRLSLNSASWSPHDPHTLIACGSASRELIVIDTRLPSDSIVWSVKHAHMRPITDVKFNPFIPYWLASAGKMQPSLMTTCIWSNIANR